MFNNLATILAIVTDDTVIATLSWNYIATLRHGSVVLDR